MCGDVGSSGRVSTLTCQSSLMSKMNPGQLSILRVFGAIQPPHVYCTDIVLSSIQEFLIENIIENPHFVKYPPSNAYQRSFWKWVVTKIETEGEVRSGFHSSCNASNESANYCEGGR